MRQTDHESHKIKQPQRRFAKAAYYFWSETNVWLSSQSSEIVLLSTMVQVNRQERSAGVTVFHGTHNFYRTL